ncbi:hypothetical protein HELRODRAFT_171444 [Helobdella robusta]|uniref:Uncharacterized protein n=1 Tax=Helobdella robusta TaxID=6412 RepID=T1F4A4_HELRO|nr:hypothetical protein HELRODRAFT_171444 [Helobdella robusta]ESO05774.1 hypothetical protein HELRODRAFT_171444 [Helobdella robusta]
MEDILEEGEITCPHTIATFEVAPSVQGSSHNMFSSYESEHGANFKSHCLVTSSFNKQLIDQLEKRHLQNSILDKAIEIENLSKQLDHAKSLIANLKQNFDTHSYNCK